MYQVILSNGEAVRVPADKARTQYECVSIYGLQAVLERARRTRAYKRAVQQDDAHIHSVICPDGQEVTQF